MKTNKSLYLLKYLTLSDALFIYRLNGDPVKISDIPQINIFSSSSHSDGASDII